MYMRWTEQLSVGNPQVDEQHQHLVALLNQLNDAIEQGRGRDIASRVLDAVADYADEHFAAEERLFMTTAYPDKESHIQKHRSLTARVAQMRHDHAAGTRFFDLELLQFLQDWLTEHIMKTDKTYVPYLPKDEPR